MSVRKHTQRALIIVGGLLMMAALAMSSVATALAAGPSPSQTITPGTFDITTSSATLNSGTSYTLHGVDQRLPIALSYTATDYSGNHAGWNVQLSATPFKTGDNTRQLHNMPVITALPSFTYDAGNTGAKTDPSLYGSWDLTKMVPITLSSSPAILYNADAGTGVGSFAWNITAMHLDVDATDYSGSFSSTFTLSLVAGPDTSTAPTAGQNQ